MANGIILSGGSSVDLAEADALVSDVITGKKFFGPASDDVQTGTNNAPADLAAELVFKGLTANSGMTLDTLSALVTSGLSKGASSASGNWGESSLLNCTKYKTINFGVDFGDAPNVSVSYTGGNFTVSAVDVTRTGFRYRYVANGGIYNGVTFYWSATKS